jgi:hypothetical protein
VFSCALPLLEPPRTQNRGSLKGMSDAVPKASPEHRARSIQLQLEGRFPDLTVSTTGSQIYIRGAFPVIHEAIVLDRYQVEIEWSDRDTEAPLLRETGGRIPRTNDRHMGLDGKACPLVPEEWLIRARETSRMRKKRAEQPDSFAVRAVL